MNPVKMTVLRGISFLWNNLVTFHSETLRINTEIMQYNMDIHYKTQRDTAVIHEMMKKTNYIRFK